MIDLAISGMEMVKNWDSETIPPICLAEEIPIAIYSRDDLIQGLFSKYDDRFVYGWNKLYRRELLTDLWCDN